MGTYDAYEVSRPGFLFCWNINVGRMSGPDAATAEREALSKGREEAIELQEKDGPIYRKMMEHFLNENHPFPEATTFIRSDFELDGINDRSPDTYRPLFTDCIPGFQGMHQERIYGVDPYVSIAVREKTTDAEKHLLEHSFLLSQVTNNALQTIDLQGAIDKKRLEDEIKSTTGILHRRVSIDFHWIVQYVKNRDWLRDWVSTHQPDGIGGENIIWTFFELCRRVEKNLFSESELRELKTLFRNNRPESLRRKIFTGETQELAQILSVNF